MKEYVCMYGYVCVHVCMYVYAYVRYMYVCYVCIYVLMYVCIYVHTCKYKCTHMAHVYFDSKLRAHTAGTLVVTSPLVA